MSTNILLKEIKNKDKEIKEWKRKYGLVTGEVPIDLKSFLDEMESYNTNRLVDVDKISAHILSLYDVNISRFYTKVCEYLEDFWGCEVTLYTPKDNLIDIESLHENRKSLEGELQRVYGDDDIFRIYSRKNLYCIEDIKRLNSIELENELVEENSVGVYLRVYNYLEGFIFFNSRRRIDKEVLMIISRFISLAFINSYGINLYKQKSVRSERDSYTDGLTGLANRRRLDKDIREVGDKVKVLLLIDIDKFKGVNDNYGYQVGDKALTELAKSMQLCFGDNKDFRLYRQGGDEFIIASLSDDLTDLDTRVQNLMEDYSNKCICGKTYCTLSIGGSHVKNTKSIVPYNTDAKRNMELLFNTCNWVCHQLKLNGKNGYNIQERFDEIQMIEVIKREYEE